MFISETVEELRPFLLSGVNARLPDKSLYSPGQLI